MYLLAKKTLTAATVASAAALAAPAMAQESPSPVPVDVSENELDAFVVAYRDVAAIEQEYGQQLEGAADDAERQAIIGEAQVEMTRAVEEAPGIGVERYVEILQLARSDADLQADLAARLQN